MKIMLSVINSLVFYRADICKKILRELKTIEVYCLHVKNLRNVSITTVDKKYLKGSVFVKTVAIFSFLFKNSMSFI